MADLLIAISLMFAGAALALGGFALGQSVERRRWLEWTRPKSAAGNSGRLEARITGGYRGPAGNGKPLVPPSGGSAVRKPAGEARDA